MSYEGFEEYICANGHYFSMNCYDSRPHGCPQGDCDAQMVWHHSVDETNGFYEDSTDTYPAPREEIGWDDIPHTDHYGNNYFTKRLKYKPAEGSAWAKLPTPEEIAERDAEWERQQAVFRQHSEHFRIFHEEELLFHTADEAEYEQKYEELWDTGNYPDLRGLNPWPDEDE